MNDLSSGIFLYLVIIFSAVFHEYSHGWMALQLGDDTAKREGRLTLNPLRHIDPFGTVLIPLLLLFTSGMFIGWAKPVPYNPANLRDQKYGSLKVGLAGPGANLLIALILGLGIRFFAGSIAGSFDESALFLKFLALIIYINIFLALFNLIPVPPLDGSKVIMDLFPGAWRYIESVGFMGIFVALFVSYYALSPIAQFIFGLIVGHGI
ncbi:site-2 protease family protein [Candidatus Wolfebacteria bacterium]|nr:site-2 protease family protein [Candidatus Wolfebacteria bacterium]